MHRFFAVITLFLATVISTSAHCQNTDEQDSVISRKKKKERRKEFRESDIDRTFIYVGIVNANLDTKLEFNLLDGFLSFNLGLESNLGLPDRRAFITGSVMHRFTPASGIYADYYGISRSKTYTTEKDLIFLADTIPAGTSTTAYFNTQVISMGYLLSIKRDPNAFLGAYFNIYLMWLNTGIKSDLGMINASLNYTAPLPNFGLIAMFRVKKWLYLGGNVGFFTLTTNNLDGRLYDFNLQAQLRPLKWLGITIAYQEFDVRVGFPYENINTIVDYKFRGPELGLYFAF